MTGIRIFSTELFETVLYRYWFKLKENGNFEPFHGCKYGNGNWKTFRLATQGNQDYDLQSAFPGAVEMMAVAVPIVLLRHGLQVPAESKKTHSLVSSITDTARKLPYLR